MLVGRQNVIRTGFCIAGPSRSALLAVDISLYFSILGMRTVERERAVRTWPCCFFCFVSSSQSVWLEMIFSEDVAMGF